LEQAGALNEGVVTSTSADDVVVRVQGFGKRYGGREAVSGVDLVVCRGEIYGLIGPDGAGKSTLMKAIAAVLAHDTGEVEVFGTNVRDERSAERVKDRLGFMPQGLGLSLYPELSVEENIDFFAGIRAVSPADLAVRKQRLLSLTRLDGFRSRAMKRLSGGMKQKLALVCTLVHEPELVILDEPTTGVDPLSRRDFWAILSELVRERRVAALVSTAYLDEASRCDRVLLLHAGRRVAEDDPESLRLARSGTVVHVGTAEPEAALAALRNAALRADRSAEGVRVFVPDTPPETARERVRDLLTTAPSALDSGEPDLEDVFLELVADRDRRPDDEPTHGPGRVEMPGRDERAPAASEFAIRADGLTRRFGAFVAVEDVSFAIRHGEIVGLLGANGAGKSTVIKMLTGILAPSSGSGRVANMDMRRPGPALRRRIGYMSQAFSLYTDLTVDENIALYAGIYGLGRNETSERRAWIVSLAGLERHLDDLAGALPMGLRQRLALGCALVHRPQMLFLDEPTSGVDPAGRRRFWEILFELARRDGVAVLVTTHALAEAEQCDQVVLMHAGRVVANSSPGALKREVAREIGEVVELAAEDPARLLGALRRLGIDATPFGRTVHVFCREPARELPALRARLEREHVMLSHAATKPLTLEDVFVHRIGVLERGRRSA
jgi:ABC-2 type transport system ATP-binding protein